jgi:hypothetical protein
MPLFDDFERLEVRPRRQNEGGFDYMNASARPGVEAIRQLLESWFEHLPPDAQADIRGRFRSRDEAQHQSAFFELYWHELLTCCAYQVEIHPALPDVATNPDFLTLRNRLPQFYLEATLAMPPGDAAADRRFAELHDTLDRMCSPDYFLEIEVRGSPTGNIRGRVIRERLERWLGELDHAQISRLYEEGAYDAVPELAWEEQGCTLTFTPIPKGPELRGQPGARPVGVVMPAEMRQLHTHEDIRAAVEGKAAKYGNLNRPLVVAVNVLDDLCEDYDIWNALFGEEGVVAIQQQNGQVREEWERAPNGALRGRVGPRNRLVSAVSIVHQLSPSNLRTRSVTLIHNPWTTNPLPLDAVPIPHATISVADGRIDRHDGRDHADIIGVPNPWPVPD